MNQEQNDLNLNNFNTQGNNGIPNNQPLNNQSFNSKLPKKMNLGLIIGIVAVVAVVGFGIVFGSKLLSNGNDGTSSSINQNLDGKVKLVKNYKQISTYIDTGDLNQIHFDTENKVIDIKGNVIINAEFTKRKYLGDDYYAIINGNNIAITKNTDEIFKFVNNGNIAYDNNTLYYTTIVNNEKFTVAYDLSNKKELWKTRGENPFILENGNIAVKGYSNIYDKRYVSYGIIDKHGNVVAFADKNTAVYPTATTYYFKLVNKKLEIYNGATKVNEFSLETKDKVFYEFVSPLSNGMFVIEEYDSNTFKNIYKVYDKDLKLIVELDDCNSFEGSVLGYSDLITVASTYNDADKSIISGAIKSETGNLDVIIYANGTIEKLYFARLEDGILNTLSAKNLRPKHYMVGIEISNETNGIKVINLDNGKSKKVTDGSWTANGIADSPNGKYTIINYDTTYNDSKKKIVLDENLESLYETENQLKVVNDKFVIEYSLKSKSEIYLVNVFTKEKTRLDTTGDYYDNNSVGLITSNNGTYNLYSLN